MSGVADKFDLSGTRCEDPRVKKIMHDYGFSQELAVRVLEVTESQAKELFERWRKNTLRQFNETTAQQAEEALELLKKLKSAWSCQAAEELEHKLLAMATSRQYEPTLIPR